MSFEVDIDHILPEYPSYVHIQWSLDFDNDANADLTYDIQRSGSPEGEWTTIAEDVTPPVYSDNLEDETEDDINQLSLNKEIWYRVVVRTDDGRKAVSNPVDNENNTSFDASTEEGVGIVPRQRRIQSNANTTFDRRHTSNNRVRKHHIHRKFLRNYLTGLRTAHGTEIAILKRKHFGQRCEECWDETTDEVLQTNCENCYGVGWEGGYFDAIYTLGKVVQRSTRETLKQQGEGEEGRARIEVVNFPRIETGDVIVKLDENDRYVVRQVQDQKIRQRTIKQTLTCKMLARTSVMYSISIDADRGLLA